MKMLIIRVLEFLFLAILTPLLVITVFVTEGIVPLPVLSTATTAKVIDVWIENNNGFTYDWCTVEFNHNDKRK